jgi:hypothetical protein
MTQFRIAGIVPAVVLLLIVHTTLAPVAHAQFGRFATKTALCLGSAVGGFYLGDKIGNLAVAKMKLAGDEAAKTKLAFKIGTAAALCGTSVVIANTVYNRLSKRDQEARAKEMDAALADAGSAPRSYVLPDSRMMGTMTAQPIEVDDDGKKECRVVVDELAGPNEPAMVRMCRTPPKTQYDVDF